MVILCCPLADWVSYLLRSVRPEMIQASCLCTSIPLLLLTEFTCEQNGSLISKMKLHHVSAHIVSGIKNFFKKICLPVRRHGYEHLSVKEAAILFT